MAKKNNSGTYADNEVMEIARKYLNGEKLTASEVSILNMYAKTNAKVANFIKQGMAARAAGKNTIRPQRNQWLNSMNSSVGSRYRPSSPGGFKSSGMDADSDERMNAMVARARQGDNDPRRARIFKDGSAWVNGRMYNADQVKAAIRRGASGATMDPVSSAIYDRYITVSMANAQIREQQQAAAQQAMAEERVRQQERLNKGVPDARKLPDGMEYTNGQKRMFNQLQQAYAQVGSMSNLSRAKKDSLRLNILEKMDEIVNSPVMRLEPQLSPEEELNKNIVVRNGVEYLRGKDGKFELLPQPKTNEFEDNERLKMKDEAEKQAEAKKQADEERKAKEKREKEMSTIRANREKEARDAITERAKELMKSRIAEEKDKDGKIVEVDVPGLSYQDAYNQATKEVSENPFFKGYLREPEVPIVEKEVLPVVESPIEEPNWERKTITDDTQIPEENVDPNNWRERASAKKNGMVMEMPPQVTPQEETQAAVCPSCGGPLENGVCYNEKCPTNI